MGEQITDSGSVQAHYDWANTTPSMAVIDAIAAFENIEPKELSATLDTTLFDHVDPEALDALVSSDSEIAISFSFGDYGIRMDGSGLTISYV